MARPRVEATVTESQSVAVQQIADEMGLSRSEVIAEALGLYIKIILEAKRGHRLVTLDPVSQRPVCELVTPTLSSMEWAMHVQTLAVSAQVLETIQGMVDAPAEPTPALREALKPAL